MFDLCTTVRKNVSRKIQTRSHAKDPRSFYGTLPSTHSNVRAVSTNYYRYLRKASHAEKKDPKIFFISFAVQSRTVRYVTRYRMLVHMLSSLSVRVFVRLHDLLSVVDGAVLIAKNRAQTRRSTVKNLFSLIDIVTSIAQRLLLMRYVRVRFYFHGRSFRPRFGWGLISDCAISDV